MIFREFCLKEIEPKVNNSDAKLRIYIAEKNESVQLRPGLIICPGGSCSFCSPREAEIIAFRFLSEGFNCFILNYTTKKHYPCPHLDLATTVSYIRKHEEEFNLLPNSLSLCGFSAGGHLVGSFSYLYKELGKMLSYEPKLLRPFSVVLAYPVTLTNEQGDKETVQNITGGDQELIAKLNIPDNVDQNYPPTFIWTTKDDELVPSVNSILLDERLTMHKVPHIFELFETGPHGLSLVNRSCYSKKALLKNCCLREIGHQM